MRNTKLRVAHSERADRPDLDPYVVQDTTWTREELLRLRGMPVRATHHKAHRSAARRAA
jgi:hypothetical protein